MVGGGWRSSRIAMPLAPGTMTLAASGPGSCVTGTVARPAVLDMVIGSSEVRRHRIRSAVRQLSFQRGEPSEDADAMLAAREAACSHRSTDAPAGTDPPRADRRPRLESVQSAGFSPQNQRLWNFDRTTEIELVEELLLQLVYLSFAVQTSAWHSDHTSHILTPGGCGRRRQSSWVCSRFRKPV